MGHLGTLHSRGLGGANIHKAVELAGINVENLCL
jgi:hypothetical protein